MDAGDYIYIVIAIVLAIINAVANKKKKDEAKRKAAELKPEEPQQDPADILRDILMGKGESFGEPQPQSTQADWSAEDEAEEYAEVVVRNESVEPDEANQHWGYEGSEEPVKSIEYEQKFESVSEDSLYPMLETNPIDSAENAIFTPLDTPFPEENIIEEFNYNAISRAKELEDEIPDMIFDHEKAMAFHDSAINIADEFDPKKAIVYYEIMRPKYF